MKEFKRDKINRQNARLSLVNSLYENPSMPRRKILLSVGANNYRPPMERSKSAPKLMAIEEAVGEEDEICSSPSFKNSQSHVPHTNEELFTVATFDRKYCKRNRNSRDTASARRNASFENSKSLNSQLSIAKELTNLYDEDDDFNNLLMTNDYDIKSSLTGELLSYLDTKLSESSVQSPEIDTNPGGMGTGTGEKVSNRSKSATTNTPFDYNAYNSSKTFCRLESENVLFNQNNVLDSLVMASKSNDDKLNNENPNLGQSTKVVSNETNIFNSNGNAVVPFILDSDEGSITSGCETASIITTTHMDDLIKSERDIDAITLSLARLPLKHTTSVLERVTESDQSLPNDEISAIENNEEDSEFSDESGFDENNSRKSSNFRDHNNIAIAENACNADANNNIKHILSSNTTKSVGRLRINIPKNAKSIDI